MTTLQDIKPNDISASLKDIAEKINNNQRLSFEDGIKLYNSSDIISIGYLANLARKNRLKLSGEAEKQIMYTGLITIT